MWWSGWPTRDRCIPWMLFAELYAEIPALLAADRLQQARGVALGIGIGFDGMKFVNGPGFQGDLQAAFPEEFE